MNDVITAELDELLDRNGITRQSFVDETYKCMLVSIFESIASELENKEFRSEVKQRFLNSSNKIITTQRIVFEKTRCKLSIKESEIIYAYLYAYLTKSNVRVQYDNSIRLKLLDQQNYNCNICKCTITNLTSELDHVVPWTLVGDELGVKNLQMLCRDCNRRKSKNSAYNLKMFLVNK